MFLILKIEYFIIKILKLNFRNPFVVTHENLILLYAFIKNINFNN